jgi:hypothetical protein
MNNLRWKRNLCLNLLNAVQENPPAHQQQICPTNMSLFRLSNLNYQFTYTSSSAFSAVLYKPDNTIAASATNLQPGTNMKYIFEVKLNFAGNWFVQINNCNPVEDFTCPEDGVLRITSGELSYGLYNDDGANIMISLFKDNIMIQNNINITRPNTSLLSLTAQGRYYVKCLYSTCKDTLPIDV